MGWPHDLGKPPGLHLDDTQALAIAIAHKPADDRGPDATGAGKSKGLPLDSKLTVTNIANAIESGPFSSLIYLVQIVIFHSYVGLPKGIRKISNNLGCI